MKWWMLAAVIALVLLITPTVSATVEPDVTTNPCDHGFIDFEEGTDGAVIRSTIPGVKFTTTEGQDWIYGDWRTGTYNGKYPDGSYTSNGDLWAWLGPNQGYGQIDFTEGTATYISFLTSTQSGVTVDAYDSDGNLLASSGWAAGNTDTGKMTRLNVSAPGMAYVLVHDTGNYWLIDDICTDAHGVRGVNLDIYTDKTTYYPNEEIVINTRVTDAYGSCLHPLSKANFDIFMGGTEVNSEDIVFEELSCSNYNLKINAPLATGDYSIEVVVDTTPGTESASLSISVVIIDSDTDGLPDYEEDKDHDGVVDLDETDPNNHDTDKDGIGDKYDLYPWLTTNRKALVIGFTEYDYLIPFTDPAKLNPIWPETAVKNLKKLGFSVDEHIDEDNDDGDVITYDEVSTIITNFKNSLSSDDVAVVTITSHGSDIFGKYFLCYGDSRYPEDAMYPGATRHVTGQLDDVGTYLDFLWLQTCHSWAYQDEIDDLGAGGIIFFGNDGTGWSRNTDGSFYSSIAGDCYTTTVKLNEIDNIKNDPGINSVEKISEDTAKGTAYIKVCSKQQRYVEAILYDINIPNGKDSEDEDVIRNVKMLDQYPGDMDLMDPFLTHRSPVVHMPEPEDPTQTPNETFVSVNYTIWDSDGDSINDTVTVSWDANTVFPEDNVTVFAYVRNSGHEMVKQYVYGPYTIYGYSPEISSFNFYATSTDTYNIRLLLYDSSLNPMDVAFITDLSLDTGTGGLGGAEEFTNTWFDTSDSNGDGIDDTINISWNADTTLPQEDVSVLITLRNSILKYGPYTIYNSLPNAGEIEFYVGAIGVYEFSLYLVDSNSEFEDSASLEVPIGVSRFTDTYADYGTDTDGDGQYDYLTIDVGMNVVSAGNYTLHGSLFHEGKPIDTTSNNLYLNEGIQTVQLKFDGQALYKSGIDGQYELRYLELYSTGAFMGHRNRAYTTSAYDHTQFQAPIILFNTFDDYGVDTSSNGLFEYLQIEANVDVAMAGNYIISGYLYDSTEDFIVSASNYTYLDIGQQTVQLNFDGYAISDSGKDGAYNLARINAYDDTMNLINSKENAYITEAYDHTQFEIRHIILDWELTTPVEVILDQSFGVNVNISNPSNRVLANLQASLFLPSEFDTTDVTTINMGNLEPEQNKTIEWTLIGINPGYGEITINITSPDIQNISITRGIIVTSDSLTVSTDKDTYMPDDDAIINATLTNDNPEVSYVDLVVNVTIQGPDITETHSTPILYIGSLETENITHIWDTTGKTNGSYTVTAKVLGDSMVLNETATSFILGAVDTTPPTASSSTPTGAPKYRYRTNENVYAAGSGFTPGTNVDIHVVQDQDWNDGEQVPQDVTGAVETVSVVNGGVGPVLVWHAPLAPGSYDIVIDANRNGAYNAATDGLDSGSPGFIVVANPPPTPPTDVPALTPAGIIALVGLLCVIGMSRIRRRFN